MPSNYVINVISNAEKEAYIRVAQSAIVSLKKKITELQQMVADNVAMPTMNQPHQVAFYIKDAIGIANRPSQSGLTSGATNESYYIRFIPINKQDIVIDLRTTDHLRGEKWSDRKDNGEHPNLRASAIVQDTSDTAPTVVPKKPHIANGITIKRVVQNIPTMLYGTPEQIIKHLNTLICLFQNGYFGKYKEKKSKPPTVDSNNKTLENEQYMNRKPLIRLTESDLRRIIKASVNRILKEGYYDFDDDFNADDVECPYCGSNNVEPISAIDTHYRCLDCGEEFYLDGGWEPDWGAMRHESHKRKGKNINEATTPTWKRWQGYTPDQKAERLAYMQQQIAQLKQQREYAKQKAKTARTPEEQQTWRNTKAQIDRELLRVVSHEHDLRVGKKMTQGAKERAAIKRREDKTKAKNRITFQPQDDPYYTNESKNMNKKLIRLTESDLHKIIKESVNRILSEIDLVSNQSGGMRIADLKEFDFYIGNTRAGSDVVASNEGIFVDDELVNTYDPNVVINDPSDLIEAIDDAISFCPSKYIRKRDRDELGCYLGASLSIKDWWKENYG